MALRTLLLLIALSGPAPQAGQVAVSKEAGITGVVLAPDGSPVKQGSVALMTSATNSINASIDRTGRFRVVPDSTGWQRLFISVPGLAPHRLNLTVPPSRGIALPDITLGEAAYFRVRFVTTEGEPLSGGLRRRVIDADGLTIPDPLGHVREQIETDGTLAIGPLPPGRMLMAFDRAPLAQTRLRDVDVTGDRPLIDGGVIAIDSGARLVVDVIDGDGKPVPRHDLWLEEAATTSLLFFPTLTTDEKGRVVFARLGAGRYRVWTQMAQRCGNVELPLSRMITSSGNGDTRTRLVVGGRASFRITTPFGPLPGRAVQLSPESSTQPPWQARFAELSFRPRRMPAPVVREPSCVGSTDGEGRFTIAPFPPGPARLRVQLFNSTYVARVNVPEGGHAMEIAVPDGLLPVRVTNQATQRPVTARVVWVGGGATVETLANANGDALLEAVGATGGTLTISERDHETVEGAFDETPGMLQEVSLKPLPAARVTVQVVSEAGEPIAGAVVELMARNRREVAEFAVADAKGIATFSEVPPGNLPFTARAQGFTHATVRIAEDSRASIAITLTRNR